MKVTGSVDCSVTRRSGVLALPFASLRGVGARTVRLPIAVSVALSALLVLAASPALAARGHEYLEETIGEPCPALEVPCGAGKLKEPSAVAVNEASGEIYVLDQGNARVVRFSSAGTVLGEFDGSGELAGEGAKAGSLGKPWEIETGRFKFPAAPQNGAIAVDNDALSPSFGDVYVADTGFEHRVVDKFTPTGEYLTQFTEGGGAKFQNEDLEGVAVDRAGTVWVYVERPSIFGFANGSPGEFLEEIRPTPPFGGFGRSGVATDSEGNFYGRLEVSNGSGLVPRIVKWDHAGNLLNEEVGSIDEANGVAVEQASGVAFISSSERVDTFSPEGAQLESFDFGGDLTEGAGIGVDAASGFAYVADSATGRLLALAPTLPGPPQIEAANQFVSAVTATEAELHSELSPQSEENEPPTTYRFQYGPCPSLSTCGSASYPSETSPATLAPDFVLHPVTASLTGLRPGTTYHYRLAAENSHDPGAPILGPEFTFTTQPAGNLLLPDSRQWEMVSPPEKQGANIKPIDVGVLKAAAGGSGITYQSNTPTESEPPGYANRVQILSRRGAASWLTRDIALPHTSSTGSPVGLGPEYKFVSADLSLAAVQPLGFFDSALSPEASESTAFLHDLADTCTSSCYHPLVTAANVPPGTHFGEAERCQPQPGGGSGGDQCGPNFLDASEDLSHIVLSSNQSSQPLTPGGPAPSGLYEWASGALTPISVLPDGEAVAGELGLDSRAARGAISADGQRVAWEANHGQANEALYLRLNTTAPASASGACDEPGKACTIQLDASQGGAEEGGGSFQFGSADGSRFFFEDFHALTADSGAEPIGSSGHADLYECRIVEPSAGHLGCELNDLTPEIGGEAAEVQGGILGASADGSYVYFVANGVLASNVVENGSGPEQAKPGDCRQQASTAIQSCNLYLSRDGVTTFITRLSGADQTDWELDLQSQPTRVSPNGRFLALMSQRSLTGYDNRALATGRPAAEVFLYDDAAAGRLRCASCKPSNGRPVGFEYHSLEPGSGGLVGGPQGIWQSHGLVAANVPGWPPVRGGALQLYQPRYLTDSGRLFFNSGDALVPQDSNGTQDVYQYEPPGVGGCTTSLPTFSARSGGCVDIISAGTSGDESAFLDASESGDDVFFLTRSRLAPQDVDGSLDVYDAHVCSTAVPCFPAPPPPAPACEGDACQQPATPPSDATPGSLTFQGPGNLLECPKGKRLQKGRCVKQKAKNHKKKKKNPHKRHTSKGRRASQ